MTGAAGFIGGRLRAALADQRCDVRALVLDGESVPGSAAIRWRGAEDRAAIDTATRGVDAVVHLAARAHVMEDSEPDVLAAYRRVNVDGTRAVAEAQPLQASRASSSSARQGRRQRHRNPLDSTTVPTPTDAYRISKREAEEVVERIAARSGMCAAILRFPLVYGPGMRANMLRLFDVVNAGMPVPVGKASRRSMIFVGNAAAAIGTVFEIRGGRRALGPLPTGSILGPPTLSRASPRLSAAPRGFWGCLGAAQRRWAAGRPPLTSSPVSHQQ